LAEQSTAVFRTGLEDIDVVIKCDGLRDFS
jgi:hypothetical protein